MSLYTLTGDYLDAVAAYEAAETAAEAQDALDMLDTIQGEIDGKADAYARIRCNAKADAAMYGEEIKRLTACKRRAEALVERMDAGILASMQATGAKKLPTSIGTWTRKLNPYSVNVIDADKVPDRFLVPQPPTVDKRGMLAEFKATGEVFDGVEFVQKESVSLK